MWRKLLGNPLAVVSLDTLYAWNEIITCFDIAYVCSVKENKERVSCWCVSELEGRLKLDDRRFVGLNDQMRVFAKLSNRR